MCNASMDVKLRREKNEAVVGLKTTEGQREKKSMIGWNFPWARIRKCIYGRRGATSLVP